MRDQNESFEEKFFDIYTPKKFTDFTDSTDLARPLADQGR